MTEYPTTSKGGYGLTPYGDRAETMGPYEAIFVPDIYREFLATDARSVLCVLHPQHYNFIPNPAFRDGADGWEIVTTPSQATAAWAFDVSANGAVNRARLEAIRDGLGGWGGDIVPDPAVAEPSENGQNIRMRVMQDLTNVSEFSDDFDRADGPLGAPWGEWLSTHEGDQYLLAEVKDNAAHSHDTHRRSGAYWTTQPSSPDCYAKARLLDNQWGVLILRAQQEGYWKSESTATSYHVEFVGPPHHPFYEIRIYRSLNGARTLLRSGTSTIGPNSDEIYFEALGDDLLARWGSDWSVTAQDNNIREVGWVGWAHNAQNVPVIDDFDTGKANFSYTGDIWLRIDDTATLSLSDAADYPSFALDTSVAGVRRWNANQDSLDNEDSWVGQSVHLNGSSLMRFRESEAWGFGNQERPGTFVYVGPEPDGVGNWKLQPKRANPEWTFSVYVKGKGDVRLVMDAYNVESSSDPDAEQSGTEVIILAPDWDVPVVEDPTTEEAGETYIIDRPSGRVWRLIDPVPGAAPYYEDTGQRPALPEYGHSVVPEVEDPENERGWQALGVTAVQGPDGVVWTLFPTWQGAEVFADDFARDDDPYTGEGWATEFFGGLSLEGGKLTRPTSASAQQRVYSIAEADLEPDQFAEVTVTATELGSASTYTAQLGVRTSDFSWTNLYFLDISCDAANGNVSIFRKIGGNIIRISDIYDFEWDANNQARFRIEASGPEDNTTISALMNDDPIPVLQVVGGGVSADGYASLADWQNPDDDAKRASYHDFRCGDLTPAFESTGRGQMRASVSTYAPLPDNPKATVQWETIEDDGEWHRLTISTRARVEENEGQVSFAGSWWIDARLETQNAEDLLVSAFMLDPSEVPICDYFDGGMTEEEVLDDFLWEGEPNDSISMYYFDRMRRTRWLWERMGFVVPAGRPYQIFFGDYSNAYVPEGLVPVEPT